MAGKKKSSGKAKHEKLPFPHGSPLGGKASLPEKKASDTSSALNSGEQAEADYYHLKLQAVDDLVTASPENSPPVSRQELRKYQSASSVHLADWIKAILLKFWFAGVICYFFVWGLSSFTLNQWDLLLILGIALGGATHLLTNNIYRFIAKKEGAYNRWMMFPGKSLAWLPLDILYALVLVLCTIMTYNGINLVLTGADSPSPALGVEPLLFGLFITLWDLLFLGIRRLCRNILADAKRKVSGGK